MECYHDKDKCEEYIQNARGFDGSELIERLQRCLPFGSSVLELGMGPGVDLDILSQAYRVCGSDVSQYFLKKYSSVRPRADLMQLNAVTLSTNRKFNGIYSNKVLHLFTYEDISKSFRRQADVLTAPGAYVLHSFWYGTEIEDTNGLLSHQVTEEKLQSLIPLDLFLIVEIARYTEIEEDDSIFVILQKRDLDR